MLQILGQTRHVITSILNKKIMLKLHCVTQHRGIARSQRRHASVKVSAGMNIEQARAAKKEIQSILDSTHANPIFIRLAWHDSGSYSAVGTCFMTAGTTSTR